MKPVRILHVVGALNCGGVETWMKHLVANVDRDELRIDFLVHTEAPAAYDSEIEALGSRIFRCPYTSNPLRYAARFLRITREFGPFDVLHSHVHHFSGYILGLGRKAGIPIRIAHSHSDTSLVESGSGLARRTYLNTMKWLIRANCTHGIGVSAPAATALFGNTWRDDDRIQVIYCGIDLAPFRRSGAPAALRPEFGFSPNDIVFGHVGRFSPMKNHFFLVDVAAEILRREPRAKFLFAGDGPLLTEVKKHAHTSGLTDKIVFAGLRSDIARLMTDALDVFLFPSIHEGLPIVLMETQAAGLRSVVSDGTPEEAIVNPALVQRLPLSAGITEWARIACETAGQSRFDRSRALDIVSASPFSIGRSIQSLRSIYLKGSTCSVAAPAGRREVIGSQPFMTERHLYAPPATHHSEGKPL
jgi:glycosyltransferase involved in cell wall biosynthesis